MRSLKIINILVILLIFTPFFNSCSNGDFHSEQPGIKGYIADLFIYIGEWFRTSIDENTHYGFNLVVAPFFVFKLAIEHIDEWPQLTARDIKDFICYLLPHSLVALSFLLNCFTLVKLYKEKTKHLFRFYLINSIILLIGLLFADIFSNIHLSQIKWGFYLYWIGVIVLCIKSKTYKSSAYNSYR